MWLRMNVYKYECICVIFSIIFLSAFTSVRGPSEPFITGDTFRAYANHVFDETTNEFSPKDVKSGDIIFVRTHKINLERFFTEYHSKIDFPYILITHNSDESAPGSFSYFLDDPKLLAWFSENIIDSNHPKLYPLPIGIANRRWPHGDPSMFTKALSFAKNQNRPILCYLNIIIDTYPEERDLVWNLFSDKPWCFVSKPTEPSYYLKDLCNSQFVLSPRGNGLDCHRTWEALLMGAIPIVRTSSLDPLFEDLPVLIIEDWHMITESYLKEKYIEIKSKSNNQEKLFFKYWLESIQRITQEFNN